jgi:hypothetical protein
MTSALMRVTNGDVFVLCVAGMVAISDGADHFD